MLFRAALSRPIAAEPSALHYVTDPEVEGIFVPSGAGARWVYDVESHPEAGETLDDWTPARWAQRIASPPAIRS